MAKQPAAKQTALQWAKQHNAPRPFIAWLEQNPDLTMSEAYRRCPSVAWMWWALSLVVDQQRGRLTKSRRKQLTYALWYFSCEFWSFCYDRNIRLVSDANRVMSKKELAYWANRLRTYVVPQ